MLTKKRKINKSSFQNNDCNLITDTRAYVYSADFHVCMAIHYAQWIYLHIVQIIIIILFQLYKLLSLDTTMKIRTRYIL